MFPKSIAALIPALAANPNPTLSTKARRNINRLFISLSSINICFKCLVDLPYQSDLTGTPKVVPSGRASTGVYTRPIKGTQQTPRPLPAHGARAPTIRLTAVEQSAWAQRHSHWRS
jgi:hypothetical protein